MTDAETLRSEGWRAREFETFTGILGTIWLRGRGVDLEVAFVTAPRHRNNGERMVHGGVLMTFADTFMGFPVIGQLADGQRCVTAQLQVQFVGKVEVGKLVIGRPELVRMTRHLAFTRGLLTVDNATVATAESIWKISTARTE